MFRHLSTKDRSKTSQPQPANTTDDEALARSLQELRTRTDTVRDCEMRANREFSNECFVVLQAGTARCRSSSDVALLQFGL